MKKIQIFLFLFLMSFDIFAQRVYIQNDYEEPLWVAVGYRCTIGDWTGDYAKGWYKVIPGEKVFVATLQKEALETIYIYAHNQDNSFVIKGDESPGDKSMYISDNKFDIKNFSSSYVQKQHPEYRAVCPRLFSVKRQFDIFSPTNYRDVTITLSRRFGYEEIIEEVEEVVDSVSVEPY